MSATTLPVNGNLKSKYDDAVFALAEETPGQWVVIQERVLVNPTFFNRRYGDLGFEFTSRTGKTSRQVYGRYVGGNFDRDKFYRHLDPHGQRFGRYGLERAA